MRLAVYPGSFDPMTNGHVDVIRRASAVFDRLVVAVLANPRKTPLLPVDTRIGIIRTVLDAEPIDSERFEVASFDGLTVDFCRAPWRDPRSFAACARSATSTRRCSSRTTTGCWRPRSIRCSS